MNRWHVIANARVALGVTAVTEAEARAAAESDVTAAFGFLDTTGPQMDLEGVDVVLVEREPEGHWEINHG